MGPPVTSARSVHSASGAVLVRLLLRAAAVGGLLVAGWLLGSVPGHAVVLPGTDIGTIGSGDESSRDAGRMQLSEAVDSAVQVTADATDAVTGLAGSSSPTGTQPDHSAAAEPPSEPAEAEQAESAEPVDIEPVDSEPVDSEPVDSEPVDSEPVGSEPVEAEPVDVEPTESAEPVGIEPADATAESTSAVGALVEPVVELTEPVTALAEPVTALAEPVTALAEPVIELAEPVVKLAEPVIQLTEPVVDLARSVTGTSRQPAPVGPTVTAHPATAHPAPAPRPITDAGAVAGPSVVGLLATDVAPQPSSGPADGDVVVADGTTITSVTGATAAPGDDVSPPCSSAGSVPAGTGGIPALPGNNGALTPPGPAVSLLVVPVAVASGLLAQRPSTSPD